LKNHFWILALILVFACEKKDIHLTPLPVEVLGNIKAVQTYGGSNNDGGKSVVSTMDGGFAVLGYTHSTDGDITTKTQDNFDYWLLKFDANLELQWSKTYGGSLDDRGSALIATSDGGFLLLGKSNSTDKNVSTNYGLDDFWVCKVDNQGEIEWEKSYGYSGNDSGITAIETSDNHFIVSGVLDVSASGGQGNLGRNKARHAGGDYWVIKIDPTGHLIWSRYFGGSFTDTPTGIVETDSQDFIIVGTSDSIDSDISNNKGSYDFWVVKIDANGGMIWEKSYGGTEIDQAQDVIKTQQGNFLIVGDTRSNNLDVSQNYGGADTWALTIDENGTLLNQQVFGGSNFDVAKAALTDSSGKTIIVGNSRSSNGDLNQNFGHNDVWVFQTNENSDVLWQQSLGGNQIDVGNDIVQLKNGTLVVVGETNSNSDDILTNKGFTDLLVIQIQ